MEKKEMSLEEYKNCILNVLIKIDAICRENNIQYFLFGGTLLGAVRHQGFIPWDDDIDIMMTFENFDKLSSAIRNGDYGINFIYIDKNKDTIYPCAKICDTGTIIEQESTFRQVSGYGAFVDVFPITYFPDNQRKRSQKKLIDKWKRRLVEHSARESYVKTSNIKTNLLRFLGFHAGKLLSTPKLLSSIDQKMRSAPISAWQGPIEYPFPVEFYNEGVIDGLFEGHLLSIPKNYHGFLSYQYGDYMKLPPESERVAKHSIKCYRIV